MSAADLTQRTALNLLMQHELLRVVAALDEARIPVLVLKGVPMTLKLFGRLDARSMVDNDVLVHRADARRAYDVLVALGYRTAAAHIGPEAMEHTHELALYRQVTAGTVLAVDLHWAVTQPSLFPIDEALLWRHTEAFPLAARTVQVLDPPMTLIHLASHVLQQRYQQRKILRDLATAWTTYRTELDLRELQELGRTTGLWHALVLSLLLARREGLLPADEQLPASLRARGMHLLVRRAREFAVDRRYDHRGILLVRLLARPRRAARTYWIELLPPSPALATMQAAPTRRPVPVQHATRLARALVATTRRSSPGEPKE